MVKVVSVPGCRGGLTLGDGDGRPAGRFVVVVISPVVESISCSIV